MAAAEGDNQKPPAPVGRYPYARRAGNLLFLSGIGPRQAGSNEIPAGIEAQCRAVFRNVRLVLEQEGSRWERLVDVTVFLTNMAEDFATYNRLWAEHFAGVDPAPCRTTVEVTRLPTPIAIELKCIATID